jgi:hypothetical protein
MPQFGPTPVLIMSNDGAATHHDYEPHTPGLNGQIKPFNFPHVPDPSTFQLREFPPESWMYLATERPELIKDYMMFPHEARVMEAMMEAARNVTLFPMENVEGDAGAEQAENAWMDANGFNAKSLLLAAIADREMRAPHLKISYMPGADRYHVEWRKALDSEPLPTEAMVSGAWVFSKLNGERDEVGRLIADGNLMGVVIEGARVLLIPAGSAIYHPRLVGISTRDDEGIVVNDFWVPEPGQREMRGSPLELRVREGIRERMGVGDLVKAVHEAVMDARARGLVPMIAVDIDGTALSTRKFAAAIFSEWLGIYDGPDVEEIRRRVASVKIDETWDSAGVLKDLGITRPETMEHAQDYFYSNFHSPVRRLTMPPIEPMVELIKIFQAMGAGTIYCTLRNKINDELPDRTSSAQRIFERLGIWNERSVIMRDEVKNPDRFKRDCNSCKDEPLKSDKLKQYRRQHPKEFIIATLENAPFQINGYRKFYGDSAVHIHVAGDIPPNSPPLPEGVFTVKPDQLMDDIVGWREGYAAKGNQLANEFSLRGGTLIAARSYDSYSDDLDRLERSVKRDAVSAAEILHEVTRYGLWHPTVLTFIRQINERFATARWRSRLFEEVLEIINHYSGSRFAAARGPQGIRGVYSIDKGLPSDLEILRAPAAFETRPLEVRDVVRELYLLPEVLASIEAGKNLSNMSYADMYAEISFGRYPRMEAALGQLIGTLSFMTGKGAGELVAVEHGPHLSLAALICLARLGVGTFWNERSEVLRHQTESELLRLPRSVRSKISHREGAGAERADLAIWNLPPEGTTLREMSKGVEFGGIVAVQSEQRADHYAQEGLAHDLLFEMSLHGGDYVLPGALLGALSFQAWMVK